MLAFAVLFPLAHRQGLFAPTRELLVPLLFAGGWSLGALLSMLVPG
jgi:hypothetical protein